MAYALESLSIFSLVSYSMNKQSQQASLTAVVHRMWSLVYQHQQHLEVCQNCKFSGLLNQKLWGWVSAICGSTSPPGDSDAHAYLRASSSGYS